MTDRGSFSVQSEALHHAAAMWRTAAVDMGKAADEIEPGVGGGDSFGVLAGSSGVSGHYDEWSQEMLTALQTGKANFEYLDAALARPPTTTTAWTAPSPPTWTSSTG